MRTRIGMRLAAALAIVLVGCGGGSGGGGGGGSTGGGGAASILTATGRVILPPGSKLSTAGLTVSTGADQQPVKADGSFSVATTGTGPALATLTNSAGQVVMLGFVDSSSGGSAQAGGHGEISAQQTAAALLWEGLGGCELPGKYWYTGLAQVQQAPQTASLAATIAARVAADPTAVSDGDSALTSALQNAENSIHPPTQAMQRSARVAVSGRPAVRSAFSSAAADRYTASHAPAVARAATIAVTRSPGRAASYKVLVQNPGEQAGVEVLPTNDNSGIYFVNHFRRRAAAFVYEVATADKSGNKTDLNPPAPMKFSQNTVLAALLEARYSNTAADTQETEYELAPANPLNGWVGSIVTAATGQSAWTPVNTGPITIPPDASLPNTTYYDVIVVGPSPDAVSSSAIAADPQIGGFSTQWAQAQTVLSREEFIEDVLFAIVSNIGLGMKEEEDLPYGQHALPAAAIEDFNAFLGSGGDLNKSIESGDFVGAAKSLLQQAGDAGLVQGAVVSFFTSSITVNYVAGSPFNAQTIGQKYAAQLGRLGKALAWLDAILNGLDICELTQDYKASPPVVEWNVAVTGEPVKLTPRNPGVNNTSPSVKLTATIDGYPNPTQFQFQWSATGGWGNLYDVNSGQPVGSGQTSDDEVNFVAGSKATDGQTSTVTVNVYDTSNGGKLYGTASTTVTFTTCSLGSPTISGSSPTWSVTWDKQIVHVGDTVTATVTIGSDYHNNVLELIPSIPGKWISVDGGAPYVLGPNTDPPDLLGDNRLELWHAPYNYNLAGTHTIVFQVTGTAVVPCTHMDADVDEGNVQGLHVIPVYFESLP